MDAYHADVMKEVADWETLNRAAGVAMAAVVAVAVKNRSTPDPRRRTKGPRQ